VREHERGSADRSQEIWTLLVFEFWHQQMMNNPVRSIRPRKNPLPIEGVGVSPEVLSC